MVEEDKETTQENCTQIDNTSYYRLPSGLYLEDFIFAKRLSFAEGSALKYLYRAGKKDHESFNKDMSKFKHYCKYLDEHTLYNKYHTSTSEEYIRQLYRESLTFKKEEKNKKIDFMM